MNILKPQQQRLVHLEQEVQKLISSLPSGVNLTGISLWRSCVAVSHYMSEIDTRKPSRNEAFYYAKQSAEKVINLLKQLDGQGFTGAGNLAKQYRMVLLEAWQNIAAAGKLNSAI